MTTKEQTLTRLNQEVYAALEKQLPQPHIDPNTSPQQAGFLLGVQAVLKKLREGYVV